MTERVCVSVCVCLLSNVKHTDSIAVATVKADVHTLSFNVKLSLYCFMSFSFFFIDPSFSPLPLLWISTPVLSSLSPTRRLLANHQSWISNQHTYAKYHDGLIAAASRKNKSILISVLFFSADFLSYCVYLCVCNQ